jgi:hypothetical protein
MAKAKVAAPAKPTFAPLIPHGVTVGIVRVPEGTDKDTAWKAVQACKALSRKHSQNYSWGSW